MKNQRTLFLLFAANSISGFAQGITMLAVPWYFNDIINRGTLFGKIYALITFVGIFWILYAGTLVDRYSRKRLFLSLNIVGCVVLGCISAIGYMNGRVPDGLALLAFATTIFIFNIHFPTLYGFGQEITEKEHYSKISSYIEIQGQMTSMLSGAMASILLAGTEGDKINLFGNRISFFHITPWSLQKILLMDASTYALAFLIILQMRYKPVADRNIDTRFIWQRFRTGLGFLWQRPYLFLFGLCSLSIFVVTLVHEYFLLSLYVGKHLHTGANVYAACQLFYAFGAVMAGLSIRKIFSRFHHPVAISILILLATILIFSLSGARSVALIFAASAVLGLTNAGSRIMRITYIFHKVSNDMIGRVNSVFSVSHSIQRTFFIFIFSLPFFVRGDNIVYAYLIFGMYAATAALLLLGIRNKLERA